MRPCVPMITRSCFPAAARTASTAGPSVSTVSAVEASVREIVAIVPDGMQEKLKPLMSRMPDDPKTTKVSLAERFQNVVGVLNDLPGRTPVQDYQTLRRELELYDPRMARRTEVVVLNKMDLPATRRRLPALRRHFARKGLPFLAISAVTGEGIPDLLAALWTALERAKAENAQAGSTPPG